MEIVARSTRTLPAFASYFRGLPSTDAFFFLSQDSCLGRAVGGGSIVGFLFYPYIAGKRSYPKNMALVLHPAWLSRVPAGTEDLKSNNSMRCITGVKADSCADLTKVREPDTRMCGVKTDHLEQHKVILFYSITEH
ncbi:hypothetical protein CBL_12246 [Carabus blaptoides fortunei]